MKISIYTDGACSENPGPGGWAAIVNLHERTVVLKGGETCTTNNRMELKAVVEALRAVMSGKFGDEIVRGKDKLEICSDSAYVVNAVNDKWVVKWRLNGWKTTKGKDVKNRDLWEELMMLLAAFKDAKFQLRFVKVKGHANDHCNEMADKVAKEQVEVYRRVKLAEDAFEEAIS